MANVLCGLLPTTGAQIARLIFMKPLNRRIKFILQIEADITGVYGNLHEINTTKFINHENFQLSCF